MALTREEIESLARCKANCVMAGIRFGESVSGDMRYTPMVTPVNVAGLVKDADLAVPHSEWAIVSGAAGKKLIAWGLRVDGRYAHVVYENEKECCGYSHGIPSEMLSPELLRVTKDLLHIEEGRTPQGGVLRQSRRSEATFCRLTPFITGEWKLEKWSMDGAGSQRPVPDRYFKSAEEAFKVLDEEC